MNFRKWWVILFCSLFLMSCSQNDTVLHDSHGEQVTVGQLKNKWIILNYWAAWCESCREEIPELNHFYLDNKNKSVLIYGVNYDNPPPEQLMLMIQQTNIDYPVLLDNPAGIWRLTNLDVVPTTFIIDPNGKLVKTLVGAVTEQLLLATLSELQSHQ